MDKQIKELTNTDLLIALDKKLSGTNIVFCHNYECKFNSFHQKIDIINNSAIVDQCLFKYTILDGHGKCAFADELSGDDPKFIGTLPKDKRIE